MEDRLELALGRIREIIEEDDRLGVYGRYFKDVASFICDALSLLDATDEDKIMSTNKLYKDILPDTYGESFLNPTYAVRVLESMEFGRLMSALYAEIRGMIPYVYEKNLQMCVIKAELFLEVYFCFASSMEEEGQIPAFDTVKEIMYWYVSDYSDVAFEEKISNMVDISKTSPENNLALDIIMNADLSDTKYLFRYGEYVSESEIRTAEYLCKLNEAVINQMAETFVNGYITGFELAGKDLSKKKTVNIRYRLGFERVIRSAALMFAKKNLKPVIYRAYSDIFNRTGIYKVGYYGALANPQYEEDHKEDLSIFLDGHLVTRRIECMTEAFEKYKEDALWHAGPACMETFGEIPFVPKECVEAARYSKQQFPLVLDFKSKAGVVTNSYIIPTERSFTIIAWPTPAIGDDFEAIFDEIIKVNTLDVSLYRRIQQCIIDTLDGADYVTVKGSGNNKTDLTVELCKLKDASKETKFENCVADVNIPAGEVFTSPVLKGTNGILHVSRVFLNDLEFNDLCLKIKDGCIEEYDCREGKAYIEENLLFRHKTLPMGEFAIGTNTYAYAVTKRFNIPERMPILIAEKMGPHFAFGDTCYSHEEDVKVYNPDGKEIVAKENDYSLMRDEDMSKAYFNCHTDVTIPYDELESIIACSDTQVEIIRNGKFVLAGCEELNKPL